MIDKIITIRERYAAIRFLYCSYYTDSSSMMEDLFEELENEGIDVDREIVSFLMNTVFDNDEFLISEINKKIQRNDLDYFIVLPSIILKLATAEILINNHQKNICIADYLSISKVLGIDRAQIGFINALLDQINVES